jgi:hypothetical protein
MNSYGPLKCRFCEYTVNRWRGKKVSGVAKITAHVREKHPEEIATIQAAIGRQTYDVADDDACEDLADLDRYFERLDT